MLSKYFCCQRQTLKDFRIEENLRPSRDFFSSAQRFRGTTDTDAELLVVRSKPPALEFSTRVSSLSHTAVSLLVIHSYVQSWDLAPELLWGSAIGEKGIPHLLLRASESFNESRDWLYWRESFRSSRQSYQLWSRSKPNLRWLTPCVSGSDSPRVSSFLVYKLQEKKAESREREENFGALQLRVEFSSCCLRVVGHGGKAERAGRLSRPALLHPFCILDDNRAFFLSLSLSLEMVDPIVVSCLLPLGKSFAWEEGGGVWRLSMCECEDEKRGTLVFEQPSSPEHRLSDLYSMALPQHTGHSSSHLLPTLLDNLHSIPTYMLVVVPNSVSRGFDDATCLPCSSRQ